MSFLPWLVLGQAKRSNGKVSKAELNEYKQNLSEYWRITKPVGKKTSRAMIYAVKTQDVVEDGVPFGQPQAPRAKPDESTVSGAMSYIDTPTNAVDAEVKARGKGFLFTPAETQQIQEVISRKLQKMTVASGRGDKSNKLFDKTVGADSYSFYITKINENARQRAEAEGLFTRKIDRVEQQITY